MLTRKQLRLIQLVRGLSLEEIVQRTGIPNQSLMVLINGSEKDGKDPNKLISQSTFEKVLALMGIDQRFEALRRDVVIEWKYQKKQRRGQEHSWHEAVAQLRKSLFTDEVMLAEIVTKTGLFTRAYLIFLYDPHADVHIVITGADKSARAFIESTFGTKIARSEEVSTVDFSLHQKLVENAVYRVSQFNVIVAGKNFKYNWSDVQAAAKEFNYNTEDLIDLMVNAVRSRETDVAVPVLNDQVMPLRRTG